MMAQSTFYPCQTVADACLNCYSGETTAGCKPQNGSNQNSLICPTTCNTKCVNAQAYCSIGIENITSHADTPAWSGFSASEIIHDRWTALAWNDLQKALETAGGLGQINPVGSPSFTRACPEEIITSNYYNEWSTAAQRFRTSVTSVATDDVIRNSHSSAISSLLSNSKFGSTTCDICNVSTQRICSYDCSCNYNCAYNCNYNCYYNCYYNCGHNCGTNAPADNGGSSGS